MTLIIYAHPYGKSFNAALLNEMCKALTLKGEDVKVIDLYGDGFNPVFTTAELALFSRGESSDPLVKRYQEDLCHADRVIFQFPIWWGEPPAILKGFFDKVMLPGFGYVKRDGKLMPGLDIKRTLVVTTSEAPTFVFEDYFKYFKMMYLDTIGFNNYTWMNCPGMSTGTLEERRKFMADVVNAL